MGVKGVGEELTLKERLIELRLEKRELVLAGKSTEKVDQIIKSIEEELKEAQKI